MKIRHFLYNAFIIESSTARIAIDPGQNLWLFNLSSLIPKIEWPSITHLVLTHGDPDHYWNADRVAKASTSQVICGKDLTRFDDGQLLLVDPRGRELTSWIHFDNVHALEIGDTVTLDGVTFEAVKSVHGPIVIPLLGFKIKRHPGPGQRVGLGSMGFKITVDDITIVNLGDSLLQNDWKGMTADILMLPIGGLGNNIWTMDVEDAITAVKMISPKKVIPCHYSVSFLWWKKFNPADDDYFREAVANLGIDCSIMHYGEEITV